MLAGFLTARSYVLAPCALAFSLLASSACAQQPTTAPASEKNDAELTFSNPIGITLADPTILFYDGVYYLYATSDTNAGFRVWTSPNLRDWTDKGMAFERNDQTWGTDHFWAPEVIEHDGTFYLFYNAMGIATPGRWGGEHRICLATSDSPTGPYTDVKAPFFDFGYATIDAFPFIDSDGFAYLYFARDISQHPTSDVYVVPLRDDLMGVAGEPVLCISPAGPQAQDWEGGEWNEAPAVIAHEDAHGNRIYLLTYSAGGFFRPEYSVGYARARNPLGPWIKAQENPILAQTQTPAGPVSGPGHGCFVPSPDGTEMFYAYHEHVNPRRGNRRELAIDRVEINEDDLGKTHVRILGPTRGKQLPLPSGAPTTRPSGGDSTDR